MPVGQPERARGQARGAKAVASRAHSKSKGHSRREGPVTRLRCARLEALCGAGGELLQEFASAVHGLAVRIAKAADFV